MNHADEDSVVRFSNRADDYVRYRPSYPPTAIDRMLSGLGDPSALIAADIGAGTGISARLLADRGVNVRAVEPNRAMRDIARPHPNIVLVDGRSEATSLPAASTDLVLCAQSFHWFSNRESLTEFRRILKRPGRLALMWNNRDLSDPVTAAYTEAIRAVGGEHPMELRPFDPALVPASGFFAPCTRWETANQQRLDLPGLLGRARSASYMPKEGPLAERLETELTNIFERHQTGDGRIALRYVTQMYLSEPVEQ